MKYKEWQKRPARLFSMTGNTIGNIEALYPYFEDAHKAYHSQYRMTGQRRSGQRIYVMYYNTPLADIRERLAFILCYLNVKFVFHTCAALHNFRIKINPFHCEFINIISNKIKRQ
jgi:hypothetical protein